VDQAKTAIAVGVAVAVVAAVVAAHTRSAAPAAASFTVSGGLWGVAATSADSAWAVGCTTTTTAGKCAKTLVVRWNGTTWTQVPSPDPGQNSVLTSVAAMSASSAWAFGRTGGGMLILRWNGPAWTRVPSPNLGPDFALQGVTATSADNAWAVGYTDSSVGWTTGGKTLILRWNGQTWSGPAGSQSPAAAPTPSPVSSPASSAVASPATPPQRQAAQALAVLLGQNGSDRAAVTRAVGAVADCSAGLSQDEVIFSNAASSRQALLGKLAALPDRSALPASMLQDLTTAWQASGQADQDFANWTQDEISHGCSTNYHSDASYRAVTVPDDQATKDKKAFAALWTAIADEYGLPLYRYNQI
jgi:hypothetical protein